MSKSTDIPDYFENSAVLKSCDFDQDGDLDIFVGGGFVSYDFGKIPNSYILQNDKGKFAKTGDSGFKKCRDVNRCRLDRF
ncbi:MAG: hypothetical protein U5K51_05970 [Flavobacteriaceae bacterium]|nr:hypothetical protein [Flavobacteriaceae bacterium]